MLALLTILFFIVGIGFVLSTFIISQGKKGSTSGWITGPCIANNKICGPSTQKRKCKNVLDLLLGNCSSNVTDKCSTWRKLSNKCSTDTIECDPIKCCLQTYPQTASCGKGCTKIVSNKITGNYPGSPPCKPLVTFKCDPGYIPVKGSKEWVINKERVYIPSPTGITSCIECPINTYQNGKTCSPCAKGNNTISAGSSSIKDCLCPIDTYKESGTQKCKQCPFKNPKTGVTCIPNPVRLSPDCLPSYRKYNSPDSINDCNRICPPGEAMNDDDDKCEKCKPGTFSKDGLGCKSCPDGTYTNQAGTINCTPCSPGYISSTEKNSHGTYIVATAGLDYSEEQMMKKCYQCDKICTKIKMNQPNSSKLNKLCNEQCPKK